MVDVSGLYLTPGLIDLHAHVFAGSEGVGLAGGDSSIFPDAFALRVGVTTVVDAGSSGRRNFAHFKKTVIDRARTRVLAFLNIGGVGMPGDDKEQNVSRYGRQGRGRTGHRQSRHHRRHQGRALSRARLDSGRARRRSRHARQYSRDGRFRRIPSRASVSGSGAEETAARRHLYACLLCARAHAG